MKNRLSVSALIFNSDNKILCVSRRDNHEAFGLPGGKVDYPETPSRAIQREVYEETGGVFEPASCVFHGLIEGEVDYYNFTFMGIYDVPTDGDLWQQPDEGVCKWGTVNDLYLGPFSAYNMDLLRHVYNNLESLCQTQLALHIQSLDKHEFIR